MALDRQSIEKKDFPVGRRGYDPDAVDAHLSALADEVDELKRRSRKRSDTLASSASEQVRAIVEAAEASANDIQREAEDEAREIREEATAEARATREQATAQAKDYVGRVSESTSSMLGRLETMETELGSLVESLRTGSNRLGADLQLLESSLGEVSSAVSPRPSFEPEATSVARESSYDAEPSYGDEGDGGEPPLYDPDGEAAAEPAAEMEAAAESNGEADYTYDPDNPGGEEGDDTEGARLIALNMALNGTPREETERDLSENFQLATAGQLLDEVYASVEG